MGKKYTVENLETKLAVHEEGAIVGEAQSETQVEQSTTDTTEQTEVVEGADTAAEQSAESEAPGEATEVAKPMVMGIGQMARHLIKNSTKSNSEILELILKVFPGSKTTPACIAWYKTDMRKKGLLEGGVSRGRAKTIELSAEELEALTK